MRRFLLGLLLGLSGLTTIPSAVLAQRFFDATTRLQEQPLISRGRIPSASVVDVNNDGRVDIYHQGMLYIQQANGTFADERVPAGIQDQDGLVLGSAFADYNNDGYLDAFVVNLTAPSRLYKNLGNGSFDQANVAAGLQVAEQASAASWGDYDNNGTLDLFVAIRNVRKRAFSNQGDETFRILNIGSAFGFQTTTCGMSTSSFNRSRVLSLFVAGCDTTQAAASNDNLFVRQGGGINFANAANAVGLNSQRVAHQTLWFDANNDGWQDLYVLNTPVFTPEGDLVFDGFNRLYLNGGPGARFTEVGASAGVQGALTDNSRSVAVADFDNDGWQDLYVTNDEFNDPINGVRGVHALYRNNGDGTFTDIFNQAFGSVFSTERPFTRPVPQESVVALGDLNNDGWVDVFLASKRGNRVLFNFGGANHWLKVKPRGQVSNRSGVGALVEIYVNGGVQIREITADGGFNSQSHNLTAHFGIGAATTVDSLRVYWSSGITDRLYDIPVDQEITVVEQLGVNNPPASFALMAPTDGDQVSISATEVTFAWEAANDPEGDPIAYTFFLRGPTGDLVLENLTEPQVTFDAELIASSQSYTWWVAASDPYSVRTTSRRFAFTRGKPEGITVAQPELVDYGLPGVQFGDVAFGDYDVDGDLDLIVTGQGSNGAVSQIYQLQDSLFNVPIGGDREITVAFKVFRPSGAVVAGVEQSAVDWADLDGDTDLDLVVTGVATIEGERTPVTQLYENRGSIFNEIDQNDLTAVYSGDVAWGDYDGDGDADLVVTGATQLERPFEAVTRIYENVNGALTPLDLELPGVALGAVAWVDYDGDDDLDLSFMGERGFGDLVSFMYRNDGDGFTPLDVPFSGLVHGSMDWGDYDADGDADLLVSGGEMGPGLLRGRTRVYRNEGNDTFTELETALPNVALGAAAWVDYDGDTDLDVVLLGTSAAIESGASWIYLNDEGFFVREMTLGGLTFSNLDVGDYNGDGDSDFILVGQGDEGTLQIQFGVSRIIPEFLPEGFDPGGTGGSGN